MIPDWYLPSMLRLLELTVQANVSFRIAICIPTSLRLFQSYLNAVVNAHFCPDTKEWLCALLHMIACTAATIYRSRNFQMIDRICVIIKLLCLIAFGMVTPQVVVFHNTFIDSPACHYYVPPYHALCEYILIVSNASFHLTMIMDTRNLRFFMYPRTCSGECEPINPEKFQKGGKFEHCRSQYHINKKWLMGNGNGVEMKETVF
uniref:G_PROTEIN_RECEP_F1_2 domain-containing protein n=1 Tax=Elaeophora elaphi TaxID=1147741 RepID=A0A0R3RN77_9BILA